MVGRFVSAIDMKLKLFVILAIPVGYFTVAFGADAATSLCSTPWFSICSMPDGTTPPHAVDISGKAIPDSSATQPDKPIILAKDSKDENWGEMKPEVPFDHTKHTTDVKYTIDGKTVNTCVECHHTAQPSAPKGQEYLKKFTRSEILTAKQLETSKEPVQSCRTCHFQESTEAADGYPPASVTYPKSTGKPRTGKLININAYHVNCIVCHKAAIKRDPQLKAPTGCNECHTEK